ncbi:hypothetical protein ZIOFF_019899 [Zingiber officinale]|uniref:Helicase ATP-binding domain-containing protein n=1 Tax=Zingiber officinale TaxID=94328 RepID=A0A8J5LBY2_ZINOF|nr:hypothetical protein ZIOFF_019899 [Zingiber officinale]
MDRSRRLAEASRRLAVARHRSVLSRRRAAVAFAAFEASAAATDGPVRDIVVAAAAAADQAAYAADQAAYAAYFNPDAAAAYAAAAAAYAAVAKAYAAHNPVGDPAAAAADPVNNAPKTPPPLIPSTIPLPILSPLILSTPSSSSCRSVNNPAAPDSVNNPLPLIPSTTPPADIVAADPVNNLSPSDIIAADPVKIISTFLSSENRVTFPLKDPEAILGMDVICQAKSGMGKTAVFVLSTLQQINPVAGQVAALVPYKRIGLPDIKIAAFCGRVHNMKHKDILKNDCLHIVAGTPRRVLVLARHKDLNLKNVMHFILDECDKMLESLALETWDKAAFHWIVYPHFGKVIVIEMVVGMADYFGNRVKNDILKYSIERYWVSLNEETDGLNDILYRLFSYVSLSLRLFPGTAVFKLFSYLASKLFAIMLVVT